jgi:hypothetical protein
LISTAPVVAFLAFITLPISASIIRTNCSWHRWLLLPLAFLPVAAFCVVRDTILPLSGSEPRWFWPHYWCDAAITLVVLYAATIILLPQAQASSGRRLAAHWGILLVVAAANVVTVVCFPLVWTMGTVGRATSLVPLGVITVVLALALPLPQGSLHENERTRSYAVAIPTAVLMLTFGLVNARLVHVVDRTTLLVVIVLLTGALILMAVAGSTFVTTDRLAEGSGIRHLPQHISEPRLRYWIPAFLFAYPVVAHFLVSQKITFGELEFEGTSATAVLLAFNLGYLGLVWVLVGFGLDQIIVWSTVEFWRKTADTLRHMAASAPLLLIGVAFFALTAETWQIAHELSRPTLWLLCGAQLAFVVLLAVGWSWPRVERLARFLSWEEVADAMTLPSRRGSGRGQADRQSVVDDLRVAVRERTSAPRLSMKMKAPVRINAMLVVLTYQFFVFTMIITVIFLMFLALARLAVPPDIAAEWIFGDGQGGRAADLTHRDVLDSPWLRVPLFLTLFSSLYFATNSLATRESRIEYFQGVDSAIRTRFAIRLGYRLAQWEEENRVATPEPEASVAGHRG